MTTSRDIQCIFMLVSGEICRGFFGLYNILSFIFAKDQELYYMKIHIYFILPLYIFHIIELLCLVFMCEIKVGVEIVYVH
jgi:hypothetical protein